MKGDSTEHAPLVECRSVGYSYGGARALQDVNLTITKGVTALLGPNGAGKSTLLALLSGLMVPTEGTVMLLGETTRDRRAQTSRRRRIGLLPQRFSLVGSMTVGETVEYAAWVNGVEGPDCSKAATWALEQVEMVELRRQRVRGLSGGQRQRVGVAAAIAHRPDLLILDEPTAGLDPLVRVQFRSVLRGLGSHQAIVMATHLVEDVAHASERVVVLRDGQVLHDGPTSTFTANTDGSRVPDGSSLLEEAYRHLLSGPG